MRVTDIDSPRLKLGGSIKNGRLSKTTEAVLWFGSIAGLIVSVMSALNICNSACSEAGLYTFLGLKIGWLGVIFFSALIGTLALLHRFVWTKRSSLF